MIIYLIRHGERDTSKDYFNKALNHQDNPLTDRGIEQAERLGAYLSDKGSERIIVSEYRRTQQTAIPASRILNLVPDIDGRVNEIDNGVIEQIDERTLRERYPETYVHLQQMNQDFLFPGGESGVDVKHRQDSLLADLIRLDQPVAIFSHEGYIRLFLCNILGLAVFQRYRFRVDFGGVTEFEYLKDRAEFRVIRVNQVV
ncbi:MAG: histidine phosphatase family protein [Caldilineales bacterium]|nr:histidine phosphatase family protein [Caldilineales bacterium]